MSAYSDFAIEAMNAAAGTVSGTGLTAVIEGTGEIVEARADTALSVTLLKAYADARSQRDVLRLARDARIKELEIEDETLRKIVGQLAPVDLHIMAVETALSGTFDPAVRAAVGAPITVDAGFIRVTWGKPRETWSFAKPASYYGQPEAKYNLMDRLSKQIADRDLLASVAAAVMDWLTPTRKLSAPSDPTITIRADKDGAS